MHKRFVARFLNRYLSSDQREISIDIVKSIYTEEQKDSFNIAKFVNENKTLQKLIMLGVDLSTFDAKPDISNYIVKANFNTDIKKYLAFLCSLSIPLEDVGPILTNNPRILMTKLENLEVRINYLRSTKFTLDEIRYLIKKYPKVLSYSTKEIDTTLSFIQKLFEITNKNMRDVFIECPAILKFNMDVLKLVMMTLNKELELNPQEIKNVFLLEPYTFKLDREKITSIYQYLTRIMKVQRETIFAYPAIFCSDIHRIKERHKFLKSLGLDQYNPEKPYPVTLQNLITGTHQEFSIKVAQSPVKKYYEFLKTI